MSDTPKAKQKKTGQGPQAEQPQTPAGERPPAVMRWYVLRVASNKEEQVRDALTRKIQIENMTDRVGRVLVPTVPERRIKGSMMDEAKAPAPSTPTRTSEDAAPDSSQHTTFLWMGASAP